MGFGSDHERFEDEVGRLRRALEELSILNDLARDISTSFKSEEIVAKVVRRSVRAIGAEQASITMVDQTKMEPDGTLIRIQTWTTSTTISPRTCWVACATRGVPC